MHRDQKVGLALGVLLIGIVGAFFFRNESDSAGEIPQLEDPLTLDSEIAEKPITPYLTGVETFEADSSRGDSSRSTGKQPTQPMLGEATSDFSDLLDENFPDPFAGSPGPPDPIRPVEGSRNSPITGRSTTIPDHNRAWDVATDSSRPKKSERSSNQGTPAVPSSATQTVSPASQDGQLYKVRQGDTLSGLASRFLGSSTRYMEIFEANRDVLKNPNDLRAGMTIRIPPVNRRTSTGQSSSVERATTPRGASASEDESGGVPARPVSAREPSPGGSSTSNRSAETGSPEPAEAEARPRRFQPVPRIPFVPRRSTDASEKPSDEAALRGGDDGTKRLSQSLPEDLRTLEEILKELELYDSRAFQESKQEQRARPKR